MNEWTLHLLDGVVRRENATAIVNTTIYGSTAGDTIIGAQTTYSKQIW